jgi:hypothetical protein
MVTGVLSLGVKQLWHKADQSPPSTAEVKKEWICTSATPTPPPHLSSWHGSYLITGTTLPLVFAFTLTKLRRVRWVGHVAHMEELEMLTTICEDT